MPGARAAAAFLDARRAPGEPVVVCSLMLTPCLQGHGRLGQGWHTYLPPEGYHHYEGTAVASPRRVPHGRGPEAPVRGAGLGGGRGCWEKEAHTVPIPPAWVIEGEWRFPEIYGDGCEIIVSEFTVPPRQAASGWTLPPFATIRLSYLAYYGSRGGGQ